MWPFFTSFVVSVATICVSYFAISCSTYVSFDFTNCTKDWESTLGIFWSASFPSPVPSDCQEACSENQYFKVSGDVLSPGFPGTYFDRLSCTSVVGFPDAQKIRLIFNILQLEEDKDELHVGPGISIDVRNGLMTYNRPYNPPPAPLDLETEYVWFHLLTDFNINLQGYNITFIVGTEPQLLVCNDTVVITFVIMMACVCIYVCLCTLKV